MKMDYRISEFVGQLKDPRRKQGQRYSLDVLMVITLMGILSGHQSIKGLARFAQSNELELVEQLALKHGVPKYNTFRTLLQHLDANVLASSFSNWVSGYHSDWSDEFIALDGKAVKSTVSGGQSSFQNFVSVVSAFGHTSGLVYGMESYENGKSAEAQSLRDLIEQLGLKDKVFTMDALHAQKKTFDLIRSIDCHFLCQIKRNCRKLWEACALCTALTNPISIFEYYEEGHGNQIYRRVELYENKADLPQGWNGIERIVKVRRYGYRNKKSYEELSFYALSKPINHACVVADAIQGHWGIENLLHWSKDVHLGEDNMTLRDKQKVTILVYLNNVALNILKANKLKSCRDTYAKISNKVHELIRLFT